MREINLLIQFVNRKKKEIKNPLNKQIKKSTSKQQQTKFTSLKNITNQSPTLHMQPTQSSNYIQLDTHNKIMQSLRQKQLQYKTKIIQLQKQNEYEINRANEFQQKFKQALLHSGDEVSLIEKLSQKENQNNQLRVQMIKLKKSFDRIQRGKANSELTKTNRQLMIQNQQLVNTIQQLKNAAISAIMAKDDQIQQLNQRINKAKQLQLQYHNLLQRQQQLEREIQRIREQSEQQQKLLSQKLARQRERYLQKLQQFQDNLHNEQSSKQELMEKAEILETNLQNKQQIIYLYQNKLNEYDAVFRQEKQVFEQEKEKLSIEIDNLKDKVTLYEKEICNLEKIIAECDFKEKEAKIFTQRLRDENAQLQRKLTIKKRKHNPKMKSSDIYSSFEGISQKSSFYSSFYKQNEAVKPSDLGQIEQLEENDVLDSFIDLEKRPVENHDLQDQEQEEEISYAKKEQRVLEIEARSYQTPMQERENKLIEHKGKQQNHQHKHKEAHQQQQQKPNVKQIQQSQQSKILSDELTAIQQKLSSCQQQIKTLKQRNDTLKKKLDQSYTQIERLTKEIFAKTVEIQNERQTLAQLRSQTKKTQSEKELIVELENFKQHVFKLENALLIEKLQCAEKEEFMKERAERERKTYDDKIQKLEQEVKNLSPKKKKGFFR